MPAKKKPIKKVKKTVKASALSGFQAAAMDEKINKLAGVINHLEELQSDLTIHVNLITRLLTLLCIEKFGMRVGVLKRLIKRVEKETIRDSQISHLENLYNLSPGQNPPPESPGSSKADPWDQVS